MKRSRTTIVVISLLALTLALSACNTTKGVATDIEKAGSSLKRSAEKNGAQ